MGLIITYDVPTRHRELKQGLFQLGYADKFSHNGKFVYLPNTTVYHPTKNPETACNDARALCNQLGIELERCIAVPMDGTWSAEWGKPF